jgi:hypothetical protein
MALERAMGLLDVIAKLIDGKPTDVCAELRGILADKEADLQHAQAEYATVQKQIDADIFNATLKGGKPADTSAIRAAADRVEAALRTINVIRAKLEEAEAEEKRRNLLATQGKFDAARARNLLAIALPRAATQAAKTLTNDLGDSVACAKAATALAAAGGPVHDPFAAGLVGGPELEAEIARLVPLIVRELTKLAPAYVAERDENRAASQAAEARVIAERDAAAEAREGKRKAYTAFLRKVAARGTVESDQEYAGLRTAMHILDDPATTPSNLPEMLTRYYEMRIQKGALRSWALDGAVLNQLAGVA